MVGKNTNICFPKTTYDKLRQVAGIEISRFVSEAVEEKIAREQQKQKEELRRKLIEGYKSNARNKKLQKELRAIEKAQFEDLNNE